MEEKSKSKEECVIPEHMINVPLKPKHELRIVARVNAIRLFILESITDKDAREEVNQQLKDLEEKCLEILKKKIADQIRSTPYESRFTTKTTKEEDGTPSFLSL